MIKQKSRITPIPRILQIYHLFQSLIYFFIYPLTVKLRILSGNNRKATSKSTSVAKDRADLNKKALAFDGEESYVEVTYSGILDGSSRTVSGWFLGHSTTEGTIISWGKDSNTFEINVQSGVIQVVADASTSKRHN